MNLRVDASIHTYIVESCLYMYICFYNKCPCICLYNIICGEYERLIFFCGFRYWDFFVCFFEWHHIFTCRLTCRSFCIRLRKALRGFRLKLAIRYTNDIMLGCRLFSSHDNKWDHNRISCVRPCSYSYNGIKLDFSVDRWCALSFWRALCIICI